ncbi:MAG: glycosyltransferase family 2 protein, partial [Clostridiales bacterium]|nr:glycosyltransferase family 2 protein [Clostridiales bacterium]
MDGEKIKVSILTTAYNHESFIGQALESLVTQKTTFRFEVIVHDDASTDGTAKVIRSYAERYPEIVQPIFQPENQYSQGISPYDHMTPLSRGEYIAICEGDDFWCDEHKLQKQVDYMDAHPECSYCFSNSYKVDLRSEIIGKQTPVKGESRAFRSREIIAAPEIFLATASVLFRKKDAADYPPDLASGHEGDIPLRDYLMTKGNAYGFAERMVCYRCMTPGSYSERYLEGMKSCSPEFVRGLELYAAFYMNFDEYTEGAYRRELMTNLFRQVTKIARARQRFSVMKSPPYDRYYRSLSLRKKFALHGDFYFPKLMKYVY